MLDRRHFLGALLAAASASGSPAHVRLSGRWSGARTIRFAVIADLHHGLAKDAMERLAAFVDRLGKAPDLDFVIQMGDFCHAGREPGECLDLWNTIGLPRHHVLGNHDLDTCTKQKAIETWGMRDRYYSFDVGGWRFVVLDLNHIREGDERSDYANGNYYLDGSKISWADTEQLEWLRRLLSEDDRPKIVVSHQPIGIWEGAQRPAQQGELLDIIAEANRRRPVVAACLCGHLHLDRVERQGDVPCWCVNSASYHWSEGMVAYRRPLSAIVTLDPETGVMKVEGSQGEWADPEQVKAQIPSGRVGVSASIADRRERLATGASPIEH